MSLAISTDDQPISVPVDALTPEGFRRWAASPEFPGWAKITPAADGLRIEGTVAETVGLEFAFCIPQSASTPAGFSQWAASDDFPQRGRLSFLQHEIVIDMSPEELNKHNVVKKEFVRAIANLVRETRLGILYVDGALLRNEAAALSTVPDALFVSAETLRSDRLEYITRRGQTHEFTELLGTPDWVLEIVSRSSARKDKHVLRDLYHRAGVAEYWLIDALGAEIDFQILVHQPGGYAAVPVSDGWLNSPVFGRRFRLTRRHDEWGHWEYTLETAE